MVTLIDSKQVNDQHCFMDIVFRMSTEALPCLLSILSLLPYLTVQLWCRGVLYNRCKQNFKIHWFFMNLYACNDLKCLSWHLNWVRVELFCIRHECTPSCILFCFVWFFCFLFFFCFLLLLLFSKIWLSCCKFLRVNITYNIFAFSIIYTLWDRADNWNYFSWTTKTSLILSDLVAVCTEVTFSTTEIYAVLASFCLYHPGSLELGPRGDIRVT